MANESSAEKGLPRTSPTKEDLIMDGEKSHIHFRHSWWRIFLVVFALAAFIITCIFNGLASAGSTNGIFTRRTGDVSDQNLTEFTPSGSTFAIWGVIYFWQAAWLLYAISRIPRKSNYGYLYVEPNTMHFSVFILYAVNMGLNIGWLIIWDRGEFGWSLLVIFLMFVTVIIPMIITHVLLHRNRQQYIDSKRKVDIWLVRLFVHNGLAVYGTWLYLATLLNLVIWVGQIYNKDAQSVTDASTAALSLVLVGIVVYFVCENFIFYPSMAYTFLPWFVLIFALSGILSKNYTRSGVSTRNKSFILALLIICCVLLLVRLIIFIVRYIKDKIPTFRNP